MFVSLGSFIYRNRWQTLAASLLFLALSIAIILRGGRLTGGSYGDNEAERAARIVERIQGHTEKTTFIAIFHSTDEDPRNQPFQDAMRESLARVSADPAVLSVMAPDDAPPSLAPGMVNGKAKSALAFVSLKGDFKEALAEYPEVRARLSSPSLEITTTGEMPFMDNLDKVLEKDLLRAELVSLPLALLVLLLVFRTAVAAALPVGVGALAVMGGIAIVIALSRVVDMAEYTINVCSLIGLGVAIDYSLFILSRYREELAAGFGYEPALARALDAAGKVVCFSGLAVGTGLVGLMFFEGSFLFAMGVGGTVVVALAVVFALTFLPALLAVLGPRIHAGALPIPELGLSEGLWRRLATWVMAHPIKVMVPTLAVLIVMGLPFLKLELASADVRVLGAETEARRGYDMLKSDFPEEAATRMTISVSFPTSPALTTQRIDALYDFAQRLAAMPHVTKVDSIVSGDTPMGKEDYESILVDPPEMFRAQIDLGKKMTVGEKEVVVYALLDTQPEAEASESLVRALRKDRRVGDGTILVGGRTAANLDETEFVRARTPRALAFIMTVTVVVLTLLLGSVVLPLKAILMNFLSVAGSFGALVWVFQEGHLGLAEPRPIEHVLPVLLFCVLFGLSMDYEVLMLSRIKEAYDRTRDNRASVADGLQRTARLITSAAAIMAVVFAAFALARVVLIRAVGFGMALAVVLDATLVRVLLVPATMRLFGDFNWWAPAPLQRLRAALGLA